MYKMYEILLLSLTHCSWISPGFFMAMRLPHFAITAPRFCHPVATGDAAVPVFLVWYPAVVPRRG
jgi:hypothetical protein